ncbi:MAG: hypothetical protein RMJ19_04040 [Gemmatales bacterium]|nr:hypothetical protein [Gemmatales bacterium]MDW8174817.1 hypothetical protein [Gemmatales bacterium]
MKRSSALKWLVAALVCASLVSPAGADDKKSAETPKATQIVIQIDASKLPPGLLKQLLQYAEPPAPKKPEGKPKVSSEDQPKKPARPDKPTAKKPHIVQVDLNQLSPDLRKRLEAELSKSMGKKDEEKKRPGKPKKDKDDDDD